MTSPKQKGFDLEPSYHEEQGVKFAFAGGLYVPAPGESERLEKEQRMTALHDKIRQQHEERKFEEARRESLRVRMKPLDVLRMRSR